MLSPSLGGYLVAILRVAYLSSIEKSCVRVAPSNILRVPTSVNQDRSGPRLKDANLAA